MLRKVLLSATLAAIVPACAAVIALTGFENPPFTLGPLLGQGGWTAFGPAAGITVENTVVKSGSQAVQIDSSLQTSGPIGAVLDSLSSDPLIELSADLMIASSTNPNGWQFAAQGPGGAFIGGINVGGPDFDLITSGSPIHATGFTRDTWHHVDLLFNFPDQTYTFTLDGSIVATGVPFCGDTTTCAGENVSSFRDGIFDTFANTSGKNDFGYMDNYLVASAVPEPSTLLLTVVGLLAVSLMKRSA